MDTPRCDMSPVTFMSNLLYATSILYKTQLPFILVFNKIDVEGAEKCEEWIRDFTAFQRDLEDDFEDGYMTGLVSSMSLLLEEFYQCLKIVCVSAVTGQGMDDLFEAVKEARKEYDEVTRPHIESQRELLKSKELESKRKELERLLHDINLQDEADSEPKTA